MNFYVTLPCSVRSHVHENTLADYVTTLCRTIELGDNWEVALTEINFPKSWYNISNVQEISVQLENGRKYSNGMNILPGRYTEKMLIKEINRILSCYGEEYITVFEKDGASVLHRKILQELRGDSITKAPRIRTDGITRKTLVSVGETSSKKILLPSLGKELTELFGLEKEIAPEYYLLEYHEPDEEIEVVPLNSGEIISSRAYDIDAGIHAIYVYSDIIKPCLIGDTNAPCLRVVSVPSETEFGHNCSIAFSNPYYYPVAHHRFRSIRITLKDKTNQKIPFQFGETLVKLHFRHAV